MRLVAALTLALIAGLACAEGPGSRLRSTPEVPQPPAQSDSTIRNPAKACADLRPEERARCLAQVRNAPTPLGSNGPPATGMGTGSVSTGMAGGAAASTAAPR
jgi:hypothetical protein